MYTLSSLTHITLGNYQNNLKYGAGVLYLPDGTKFSGVWENDVVMGGGEVTKVGFNIPNKKREVKIKVLGF